MKRSVLVLGLALVVVVFLTIVLVVDDEAESGNRAARLIGPSRGVAAVEMPAHPLAVRQAGEEAFRKGDYERAHQYFEHYLSLRPESMESYTWLAINCLMLDQPARANDLAQVGLVRTGDERPGPFYFILAVAAQARGNAAEAEEYLLWAHAELGNDILPLLRASWAAPLQGSPALERLHRQALPDAERPEAASPPAVQ